MLGRGFWSLFVVAFLLFLGIVRLLWTVVVHWECLNLSVGRREIVFLGGLACANLLPWRWWWLGEHPHFLGRAGHETTALLLGTSRDSLIGKVAALLETHEMGHIQGAALDVYGVEPVPANSQPWRRAGPLGGRDGCSKALNTPRMGYVDNFLMNIWCAEAAENVERGLDGKEILLQLMYQTPDLCFIAGPLLAQLSIYSFSATSLQRCHPSCAGSIDPDFRTSYPRKPCRVPISTLSIFS